MEEIKIYECLYNKLCKDYKNKFIQLNCWKKVVEKFKVTPDKAENKYNYISHSFAAIFHFIWQKNIKLGSWTCPVHWTSQVIWAIK